MPPPPGPLRRVPVQHPALAPDEDVFSSKPSIPVAMISAYISSSLPPERATLIDRPRPAEPITSSAVTVRISDTAEAIRRPVAM